MSVAKSIVDVTNVQTEVGIEKDSRILGSHVLGKSRRRTQKEHKTYSTRAKDSPGHSPENIRTKADVAIPGLMPILGIREDGLVWLLRSERQFPHAGDSGKQHALILEENGFLIGRAWTV
jgi:hypothetical protein